MFLSFYIIGLEDSWQASHKKTKKKKTKKMHFYLDSLK